MADRLLAIVVRGATADEAQSYLGACMASAPKEAEIVRIWTAPLDNPIAAALAGDPIADSPTGPRCFSEVTEQDRINREVADSTAPVTEP